MLGNVGLLRANPLIFLMEHPFVLFSEFFDENQIPSDTQLLHGTIIHVEIQEIGVLSCDMLISLTSSSNNSLKNKQFLYYDHCGNKLGFWGSELSVEKRSLLLHEKCEMQDLRQTKVNQRSKGHILINNARIHNKEEHTPGTQQHGGSTPQNSGSPYPAYYGLTSGTWKGS
jgi:hypothetical protein